MSPSRKQQGDVGVAEPKTKAQQTMALAEKAAFPLLCTMEPEDAPG